MCTYKNVFFRVIYRYATRENTVLKQKRTYKNEFFTQFIGTRKKPHITPHVFEHGHPSRPSTIKAPDEPDEQTA